MYFVLATLSLFLNAAEKLIKLNKIAEKHTDVA